MNSKIFNTEIETSLRILINLDTINKEISKDVLIVSDFLTLYGKLFNITDYNLHGDSPLSKSEFPTKRELITNTLNTLVLDGFVKLSVNNGFKYSITEKGKNLCDKLKTQYADEYKKTVLEIYKYLDNRKLLDVIKEITSTTIIGG